LKAFIAKFSAISSAVTPFDDPIQIVKGEVACYNLREMNTAGYSLSGYGEMIADRVRTGAFVEALRAAIRPGAVVMDIGTGPGVMAVLACQLGAKSVYAIEPSEVVEVAREIAAANLCVDKNHFF
jgi:predicted RNA methylase